MAVYVYRRKTCWTRGGGRCASRWWCPPWASWSACSPPFWPPTSTRSPLRIGADMRRLYVCMNECMYVCIYLCRKSCMNTYIYILTWHMSTMTARNAFSLYIHHSYIHTYIQNMLMSLFSCPESSWRCACS